MARQLTVELVGDSTKFERAMKDAGEATGKFADKAESAGKTANKFAGAMDRAAGATDASESKFIGTADILGGLGDLFGLPTEGANQLFMAFGDLSGGFAQIGPLIGKVGGAFSSLAMGPVGLIIAGIAALAVGVIALYKNSETFRDVVSAAFEAVKSVVGPILDTIGKAVSWVTGLFSHGKKEAKDAVDVYKMQFEALNAALDAQRDRWQNWADGVTTNVESIQNPLQRAREQSTVTFDQIAKNLEDNIKFYDGWISNLNSLTDRGFGALAEKMYGLGPTAEKAVGEMTRKSEKELQALTDRFAAGGNDATRAFTGSFLSGEGLKAMGDAGATSAMSFKNGFSKGMGTIDVPINRLGPAVPRLASGGIVTGPTLAVVGDNPGGREAVVPLTGPGAAAGIGSRTYQLTVYALDPRTAAETVVRAIDEYEARNGSRYARA